MSAASFKCGKHDSIRRQLGDHRFDCSGFNKWMIDQKQKCARRIPWKRPDAGLKGSGHTFFVIRIENHRVQLCSTLDFLAMVADDYKSFLDGGSGNRIQDVLEKG